MIDLNTCDLKKDFVDMPTLASHNLFGSEVAVGGDFLKRFNLQSFFSAPKLIGLTGKARSGKDTVAGMLKDAYNVKSVAYADPIRGMLAAGFDFGPEHFNGKLKEQTIDWIGKSPRQMMQTLGTEWGRVLINENLWLLVVERKIDGFHEDGHHVVVTDVRFENEAEQIRKLGGVLWHVHRKDAPQIAGHKSEAGVEFRADLGDVRIDNNGTLDDLLNEVLEQFEGGI